MNGGKGVRDCRIWGVRYPTESGATLPGHKGEVVLGDGGVGQSCQKSQSKSKSRDAKQGSPTTKKPTVGKRSGATGRKAPKSK